MCGIAGWVSAHLSPQEGAARVRAMSEKLAHRGPDGQGHWQAPGVWLGHRRLAILDLSPAGQQPFHSACGRYVMVYNGEVYNFRQLSEALSLQMRSRCDTEVVLEAYVRHGIDAFQMLEGMFALAIWDRQAQSLTLARDQLGIKPLFYGRGAEGFSFASELGALRATQPCTLRPGAFPEFFRCGFIAAPGTVYQELFQLPPASWARIESGGGFSSGRFWHPRPCADARGPDAEERLEQLLRASVRGCLQSDVPCGAFLSGGVDSSLVSALAQQASPGGLDTFCVSMPEHSVNEAPFARAVARALGSRHHEVELGSAEAARLLAEAEDLYAQPFVDTSAAPTMLVSRAARSCVTVALSGDGGDELFLGYGAYAWARRLARPAVRQGGSWASRALSRFSPRWRRAARLFNLPSDDAPVQHIFSLEQSCFSQAQLQRLTSLSWQLPAGPWEHEAEPEQAQSLFDLSRYLPDDLLTKVDRASMHASLEVRVPLLSPQLVEFAFGLPRELRASKRLLKRILARHLPEQLFQRPKRGFSLPLARWMRGSLAQWVDERSAPAVVSAAGICRVEEVVRLRQQFAAGRDDLATRLWMIASLHGWLAKQRG